MPSQTTSISDLYVPSVWISGVRELMNTFPSLLSSSACKRDQLLDTLATGPGSYVTVPHFKDVTDTDDEIQVESTAPETHKITQGTQVAPILNRVTPFDSTALADQVSGSDPVRAILEQLTEMRAKQRQKTMVSILRGLFGTAISANSYNRFVESIAAQTGTHLISADHILDAATIVGERMNSLRGCAIFAHSTIINALRKQDENSFVPASVNGNLTLDHYKGCPIICSDSLVRAGTTDGFVYDTYLLGKASIGWGEKPQSSTIGDVAHLVLDGDAAKNNVQVYDRTRFIMHIAGTRWKGTPAGQSATNAELAVAANWELAYQTASRVPVVRIQTNG